MQAFMLLATGLLAQFPRPNRGGGGEEAAAVLASMCMAMSCWIVLLLPMIIGMWKVYTKAGEPGWASIVPIYNVMVLAKIAGRDPVYGLLTLIPLAGIIFYIIILLDVAKQFDVGGGFVAGLILLPMVFWPILGFGSATFRGRRGGSGGGRRSARSRYDDDDDDYDDRPRRKRRRDDDDDY